MARSWTLLLLVLHSATAWHQPEQMHISYGGKRHTMWATWVIPTTDRSDADERAFSYPRPPLPDADDCLCLLQRSGDSGERPTAHIAAHPAVVENISASTYRENRTGCRTLDNYGQGCTPWSGRIYTAFFTNLVPDATYTYACGSAFGMSPSRSFVAPSHSSHNGSSSGTSSGTISDGSVDGSVDGSGGVRHPPPSTPTTFAVYGDQGSFSGVNPNGGQPQYNHTYPGAKYVRDSLLGPAGSEVRFVAIIGDVAYANGNQPIWDAYGRDMEPLFARIPALLSPGNHDGEFKYGNTYSNNGEGGGDSGIAYALRYPGPGSAIKFDSQHVGRITSTSMYWSRTLLCVYGERGGGGACVYVCACKSLYTHLHASPAPSLGALARTYSQTFVSILDPIPPPTDSPTLATSSVTI